jgi:GH18 family chitinase
MKHTLTLLTILLLAPLAALHAADSPKTADTVTIGSRIVVGYALASRPQFFTEPATRDFILDRVTHIVLLGAAKFDEKGIVTVDEKLLTAPLAATRAKNRRISVVFGGPYARVFADTQARDTLIAQVVAACQRHQLDGADFDYEYPNTMQDRTHFEAFLNGLRITAPKGMLISAAVNAWGADKHLVPIGAMEALDWVFLMAYGPHPHRMTFETADRELRNCLAWGVPPTKLVLGLPIYGANGTDGPGYRDLLGSHVLDRSVDAHKNWHFNGPATIEKKTRHAAELGLGGIGWWYVGLDCQDDRSLMQTAVKALRDTASNR